MKTLQEIFHFLLRHPALLLVSASIYAVYGTLILRINDVWWLLGLTYLFATAVEPFILRYVGDQLLEPERPLRHSLQDALRRLPASFGSNLLMAGAVLLGGLAFLLPGLFLLVVLSLALPAVVLHGVGVTDSLSVSWHFTRRHRWQMGLLLLLTTVISLGTSGVTWGLQRVMDTLGSANPLLVTVVDQALAGLCMCLMSTVHAFSYLRLSGEWTGEPRGR